MMGDFYCPCEDKTGHAICIFIQDYSMEALRCMVFGHAAQEWPIAAAIKNGAERNRCILASLMK
jgi:hypothetical protein